MSIKSLGKLGRSLFNKELVIDGVPNDLRFTLLNMYDHLKDGGIVTIRFNGNGDIFEARKEEKDEIRLYGRKNL